MDADLRKCESNNLPSALVNFSVIVTMIFVAYKPMQIQDFFLNFFFKIYRVRLTYRCTLKCGIYGTSNVNYMSTYADHTIHFSKPMPSF